MAKPAKISKTKIGIFGIKKFDCTETIKIKLQKVSNFTGENVKDQVEVFTTEHDGVCSLVRDYCADEGIKCTVIKSLPELDKDADIKRNSEILRKVATVIVFTDNHCNVMKMVADDAKAKRKTLTTFCLTNAEANYYKVAEERPATETMVDQKL